MLKSDSFLLKETTFLFSSASMNQKQAEAFVFDLLGKKGKARIQDSLVKAFCGKSHLLKLPLFMVTNAKGAKVFSTTLDSLYFYKEIIYWLEPKTSHKTTSSPERFSRFYGPRSMVKAGDYLAILNWQQSSKLFIYHIKTAAIDSITLLDNMAIIQGMLNMCGKPNIQAAEMMRFFKETGYPAEIAQFNTNIQSNGQAFSTAIDFLYLDPKQVGDTLDPQWGSFVFSYDPIHKSAKINLLKRWAKDSLEELVTDKFVLDYHYFLQRPDSSWLIGGRERELAIGEHLSEIDKLTTQQPFFVFKQVANKSVSYADSMLLFEYPLMVSFEGKPMNDEGRVYPYLLREPYIIYKESNIIENYANPDAPIFMEEISPKINWVYDAFVGEQTLHLLVQEEHQFVLYVLNRQNHKVLQRFHLGKADARGDVVYAPSELYYLNKVGQLIHLNLW